MNWMAPGPPAVHPCAPLCNMQIYSLNNIQYMFCIRVKDAEQTHFALKLNYYYHWKVYASMVCCLASCVYRDKRMKAIKIDPFLENSDRKMSTNTHPHRHTHTRESILII